MAKGRNKIKGPRSSKKQQDNVKSYFKKHRIRLQSERNGERKVADIYQILPKNDFDRLSYLKGIWKMNNVLVDTSRYFEAIEKDVTDYFLESTEKYVDQQMLSLHVVPYSHRLCPNFFTLKLVVTELFLIPRILDYHFQYYLNDEPERENSKENRVKFLNFIEFEILQLLHVRTPFNYIVRGNKIVAWLREKRRKIQTKWPLQEVAEDKKKNTDIAKVISDKALGRFTELEILWIDENSLQKDENGNYKWSGSKKNLAIAICLMNEKKYFLFSRNIFDRKHSSLRHSVKHFFETRYQINLDQCLEPSRMKSLKLSDYNKTPPFSFI